MRRGALLAFVGVLFACDGPTGTLAVFQPLVLKNRVDINTPSRTSIPAGNYKARIEITPLHAQIDLPGFRNLKFKIKNSGGRFSPNTAGVQRIALSARESNQTYDLNGSVDTAYSDSEKVSAVESCSYQAGSDENGSPIYQTGSQDVEYHWQYTNRGYSVDVLAPNSSAVVARFTGQNHSTDKIYDYVGVCT